MGLFSYLFSGGASGYSQDEHHLSKEKIDLLFNHVHTPNVSYEDKHVVKQAILDRRGQDEKISLRAIYETLTRLMQQRRITKYDRKVLIKAFQEHFKNN